MKVRQAANQQSYLELLHTRRNIAGHPDLPCFLALERSVLVHRGRIPVCHGAIMSGEINGSGIGFILGFISGAYIPPWKPNFLRELLAARFPPVLRLLLQKNPQLNVFCSHAKQSFKSSLSGSAGS